jgi:hypothetical protein
MYILYGWETGIYNEFRHLQSRGLSKAQLMELVLFAQLQAGMRGLQHVYNAVGRYLPDWSDGPGEVPLPEGWAPDPEAFKAGLDLSKRELTAQDRERITSWYERTIGSVPDSVASRCATTRSFTSGTARAGRSSSRSCPSRRPPT